MEKEEVKKIVESIKELSYDNETAHEKEDFLYYEFVEAISKGFYNNIKDIEEIAKEINKVREINFARWRA